MTMPPVDPLHYDALRHCPNHAHRATPPADSWYEVKRQARNEGDARIMLRAALLEWLSVTKVAAWYRLPTIIHGDLPNLFTLSFAAEVADDE